MSKIFCTRFLTYSSSPVDSAWKQPPSHSLNVLFSNAYVTTHKICLSLSHNTQNVVVGQIQFSQVCDSLAVNTFADVQACECKDSFVFEVLDTELEYIDKEKIKYVGKCSRCAASLKLNAKSLQFFSQFVGKPTITIRKSKYQELFDSNE